MARNTQIRIIPTVLANTKEEFDDRLAKLLPVCKELQIDMMDGQFVPSCGVALDDIPDLRRWAAWTFEAHIMVYHPERYLDDLAEKGFKRVIFHYEATEDDRIGDIAQQIRDLGMRPLLALNPETPPSRIVKYSSMVDGVLFLGVHPGFNGAPYVSETPARIAELVTLTGGADAKRSFFIQVDGGMTPETAGAVVLAGATRINSGSFVSKSDDPGKAIAQLQDAVLRSTQKPSIPNAGTTTLQKTKKEPPKKSTVKKIPKKRTKMKRTTGKKTAKKNKR